MLIIDLYFVIEDYERTFRQSHTKSSQTRLDVTANYKVGHRIEAHSQRISRGFILFCVLFLFYFLCYLIIKNSDSKFTLLQWFYFLLNIFRFCIERLTYFENSTSCVWTKYALRLRRKFVRWKLWRVISWKSWRASWKREKRYRSLLKTWQNDTRISMIRNWNWQRGNRIVF